MAELIQFAASLAAIFALAWLVGKLRLGGTPTISNEEHAARLAGQIIYGFQASEIALDKTRGSALLRDADNRMMVIFAHGSNFAGRLLASEREVRLNHGTLEVTPTDSAIGTIRLQLEGNVAQEWAASLRRLRSSAKERGLA